MKKIVFLVVVLLCLSFVSSLAPPIIKEVYTPDPVIYVIFDDPTNVSVTYYALASGLIASFEGANVTNGSVNVSNINYIDLNPPNATGNTFIFEPVEKLIAGDYTFKISAEDFFGNSGTFLSNFKIVELPFNVSLVDPPYGVGKSNNFPVKINTFVNASCRYKDTDSSYENSYPFVDDGIFHSLKSFSLLSENVDYPMYVKCLSSYGDVAAVMLLLRYDTSAPVIQSLSAPDAWNNKVVEPLRSVTLQALTDEDSRCEYSQNGDDYELFGEEFSTNNSKKFIGLDDFSTQNFKVKCMNKAGLYSSEKDISIEVNTGLGLGIAVISPTAYMSSLAVPFIISTSKSSSCSLAVGNNNFTIPLSSADGVTHTYTESLVAEGNYSYKVGCSYLKVTETSSGYDFLTEDINFVVDTTPPSILNVTDEGITSSLTSLKAIVFAEDLESGIRNYYFAVGTSAYSEDVKNWTLSESSTLSASSLNLSDGSTYYFSVIAENNAGMNSSVASSGGVVVNSSFVGGNITEVINRAGCVVDSDADGYGLGCVNGKDCNDQDASVNAGNCGNGCIQDSDGDGYGVGCYNGRDCNDFDSNVVTDCSNKCRIDSDNDSYGPGCINGADCNDYDASVVGSCDTYVGCSNDNDCDGIDDDWESQNGLDPNLDDSRADPDNDGISNLDEYRANTDPNSSGSSPTVQKPQTPAKKPENEIRKGIDWVLISIVVIFVLLLGIGGYYVYSTFSQKKQSVSRQAAPKPSVVMRPSARVSPVARGEVISPAQRRQLADKRAKELRRERISKERDNFFDVFTPVSKREVSVGKKEIPKVEISEVGKRILKKAYEAPSKKPYVVESEEFKGLSKFLKKKDAFEKLEAIEQPVKDVFRKIEKLGEKDFNKLDEMIKEENLTNGEVFDKLSRVGAKKASRDDFVNKLNILINKRKR